MTYKEILFFIGKSLTINHENHNRVLVEEELKSNKIDWDAVVKVSTSHYVFPALYCNLKKADFLHYLPDDLVEYMKRITDLNRERNQQIIEQAKEINDLLLENHITPIFLKGTGNLLEDLYDDITERMVGDIDFLVSEENLYKANKTLLNAGYYTTSKKNKGHRHLPRLIKRNRIGAVEIHKEIIKKKYSNHFNFNSVYHSIKNKKGARFLSNKDKLKLVVLSYQINDFGYYYKNINLKQGYDIFLISIKNKELISQEFTLYKYFNSYMGLCSIVFNTKQIRYKKNKHVNSYIKIGLNRIGKKNRFLKFIKNWQSRTNLLYKSFYNQESRNLLFSKIFNLIWIKNKLGFKPNL
ncbi:hypothetical protein BTO18_08655 [Polaribacter porphyrae]|uniref:Nucleotidyltransferase n=2 Tax=Polaribacter porphyrae TaxID=1137780 RepID=A0A2S7WNQ2_9FLAO|nr:hypothetical protein BTO18_08655 [Polaribacter porphyrae]